MSNPFGVFGQGSLIEKDNSDLDGSINYPRGAAETPQYLIRGGDIFHSTIDQYDTDAPCLWVETGMTRLTTLDSSGHYSGDGKLVARTPTVCMKYGIWAPKIQEYLSSGKIAEEIQIRRMTIYNKEINELQTTQYNDCYFTSFEQRGDRIYFSFSFAAILDAQIQYLNNGQKQGMSAYFYDYSKNKIDVQAEKKVNEALMHNA